MPDRSATMNVLAIDTSANLCAACIYDADEGIVRGRSVLDIGKGHAEHLMATIATALEAAGLGYPDLGRIAVAIGPGSFTGVRVGVSAARGLALALKIPAIGVSTLEALAVEARTAFPDRAVAAVIDGRRGDLYLAGYDCEGEPLREPAAVSIETAREFAATNDAVLVGNGADMLAASVPENQFDIASRAATGDIATNARLAALRKPPFDKPKPLYLRGADAKPQTGFALRRAED
jgi:tRNA threonylcarbamoyl adenosine modification protein YeaZ